MAKRTKKKKKKQTQLDVLLEFFEKNPNRDIRHPEVVDWATKKWRARTGSVFRDPDRGVRSLHEKGILVKVKKGVYRYNPKAVRKRTLQDFTPEQKQRILKRDDYRCVICGLGEKEGVELHVDHIKPKRLGGQSIIENGQTLCAQHNFMKKTLKQTETGKRMFIRLYDLAKKNRNKKLQAFCKSVLKVYEKYDINEHIKWKK